MAPHWGRPQLATAPLLSLLLLFLLPAPGGTATLSAPRVRYHTLANGLGLYHVKVDEATSFKLSVTVWVGSVDEDPDKNGGVSHLLEHLLFHQPDMTETEFKAQIKSRGGTSNAATARDYTDYYVTLPAQHLDLGQQWLYKVLFHDRLVTDRLAEEKEIVNRENGWSRPTWWQTLWNLLDPDYLKLVPGQGRRQMALRRLSRLSPTVLLFIALAEMLAGAGAASERPRVRWYAVHGAVAERSQSLNLGDGSHSLLLKGGWSCTVGSPSKQLPLYEARTTTCQKRAETFEFSVQCERQRRNDHTEIRFRHADGTLSDFIEVGCELAGSAD